MIVKKKSKDKIKKIKLKEKGREMERIRKGGR
jgi:hypothetical protein